MVLKQTKDKEVKEMNTTFLFCFFIFYSSKFEFSPQPFLFFSDMSAPQSTMKEYHDQYKKEHPLLEPSIRGFVMQKPDFSDSILVRTEDVWANSLALGFSVVEPSFGLHITGSVFLSAFTQSAELGITPEQCLAMGLSPYVIYKREGTNVLHFAICYEHWNLVKDLVTKHEMSLVQLDGRGKPSFYYSKKDKEFPVDFLNWLKQRPDIDQIVESNVGVSDKFQRLKADRNEVKELKDKQQDALKRIQELTEQVRLLGSVGRTTSVAVTPNVVTPTTTLAPVPQPTPALIPQPTAAPTPQATTALVATTDKENEKENDSNKLVLLKTAIDTTRLFLDKTIDGDKQIITWFDRLVLLIESKEIHKIRASFRTVNTFTQDDKTKRSIPIQFWINEHQI